MGANCYVECFSECFACNRVRVRSSHQFALIITVWKLITITQFTSQRFNKIHDFHDGAILEELVDYYKMQQQLTLTQGHLSRDDVEFSPK